MFRSLALSALPLVALILALSAPAAAQDAQPIAPSNGVSNVASGGSDSPYAGAARQPRFVLTIAGEGEIGLILGSANRSGIDGVFGPTGGARLYIGHEVAILDERTSLSVGYTGALGIGVDGLFSRDPDYLMITQRHGVFGLLNIGNYVAGVSVGVGVLDFPGLGAAYPGFNATVHIGWAAGPVWIGIPFSFDIWFGARTMPTMSIGLALGGTTF